jgi:lysophospholipase L1-like esterase
LVLVAVALVSCAVPPPPPAPPPKPIGPPTDTVRIALTDLGTGTYYGHAGGLYPNGLNQPPPDQDSAARARRNAIEPYDVNGDDSPFGRYVLLSIGGSTATQIWCSPSSAPPCTAWSFTGRAAMDPAVNRASLVIVNGAVDSADAKSWMSPASPNYERIKVARLAPLGLSENQVQAAWVHLSNPNPAASLPADSADAYQFLINVGQVVRTLKIRYPNLQIVFLSSPLYGGYATPVPLEPFAFEEGFSVKWAIESQIMEMRGQTANPLAGTLSNFRKAAPVLLWAPYFWTNGTAPRSDGTAADRIDFEPDGVHPSQTGENKLAAILLEFFRTSPYTRCWFVANQYCL